MELIDIVPEFNLYEEYWKIYTRSTSITPQFFGPDSVIERTIAGEGTEVYGKVYGSVIGCDVTIGEGSVVRNSILMDGTVIGSGCTLDKVICAENTVIGNGAVLGEGEEAPNDTRPDIYCAGLVTIGENSVIPDGVHIGKNVMISGKTAPEDYPEGRLASGRTLVKEDSAS
jgi:glucose-1-phosphate adenylyltransferase